MVQLATKAWVVAPSVLVINEGAIEQDGGDGGGFTVNAAEPVAALPHAAGAVTVTVYGDPDAGQLPAEVMKEPVEVVVPSLVHAAPTEVVHV